MSALTSTANIVRLRRRRRQAGRESFAPDGDYIPSSTADLWRSAKPCRLPR